MSIFIEEMNMKRRVINLLKKIKYGVRFDSETYIAYLKKLGIRVGERTVVFDPRNTVIDETRPWLIKIGDDVQLTSGVKILTHGYDWSVLKGKYGIILGSSGKVEIGNNVFLGMNTTVLKGVTIGNNVIIGSGSLVNADIPDNCVAVGTPAKVICTLEEYLEKRKRRQLEEAKELVREYRKVYHKNPDEEQLAEFFWIFCGEGDKYDTLHVSWKKKMRLLGNEEYSIEILKHNKKHFVNMEDFLQNIE